MRIWGLGVPPPAASWGVSEALGLFPPRAGKGLWLLGGLVRWTSEASAPLSVKGAARRCLGNPAGGMEAGAE